MRALIGVDLERYLPAVDLCRDLSFEHLEAHLLHVISPVLPGGESIDFGPEHPINKIQRELEQDAKKHLAEAASALGQPAEQRVEYGSPAKVVMTYADRINADLIAIGSAQKGTWSSLFYGSMTKAMSSNARQCLLVGKNRIPERRPLRAVWATDHSEYNNRCLDKFLSMSPGGLQHVTVLSSSQMDESVVGHMARDLPEAFEDIMQKVVRDIQNRSERLCQRLRQAGIESEPMFLREHPTVAIDTAMRNTDADLLILGAQGHNFWERIRLGSVSHHALIATPHNAMIVRLDYPQPV